MTSCRPASDAGAPRFVADPLPEVVRRFERAVGALAAGSDETSAGMPAAQESLDEACARARAEGYAAGRAELPWSEAERLGTAIAALEQGALALATLERVAIRAQRRAIVELALVLAEKLVRRALRVDRELLASIVERALCAVDAPEGARLRMSADDLATVEAGHAPAIARLAADHDLVLQADPELAPGDLRLGTSRSDVDARLASCLRRLADGLADLVDADEEGR